MRYRRFLYFVLSIAAFTASITVLSYIRYLNFFTSNDDLGIFIQQLSSVKSGLLLYEAGDFQGYGTLSYLEIHATYIELPYAFLYNLAGTPVILFATEGFAVAIGTIPLYLISRHIGLKRNYTIALLVLYLLSFPMISSLLYDFHWMSFIPFFFFSMFYLISVKRYFLAGLAMLFGSMTLEVFPFLALGILLYFFVERGGLKLLKRPQYLFSGEYINLYILVIIAIAIFIVERTMQLTVIPVLLNNQDGIANLVKYGLPSLIPSTNNLGQFEFPITYWPLIYASFGFIPLLDKKSLILSTPWLYETFLLHQSYANVTEQYNLIALPAVVIGLAFGLKKLSEGEAGSVSKKIPYIAPFIGIIIIGANLGTVISFHFYNVLLAVIACIALAVVIILYITRANGGKQLIRSLQVKVNWKHALILLVLLLLVFNFLAGPLNTNNSIPTIDSGYAFSYSLNPEFHAAESLAGLVPSNATVAASDNLFPLVATDINAYSFYWLPLGELGRPGYYNFSDPGLFQYIFIDQSQKDLVPPSIMNALSNTSLFGVRASVVSTNSYPGNITLYERNYTGIQTVVFV
ncbi:putative membrane protein [Thermoplasmatales archaeon]|nr:putative membrane protein [Thermoplasmatales archaeon]